jgi:hypothetical protein
MTNCRTGCPTQDHGSYSECLRRTGPRIAYCQSANGWDASKQARWDRELSRYRDLTASGVEPEGTTHREMDQAERVLNS